MRTRALIASLLSCSAACLTAGAHAAESRLVDGMNIKGLQKHFQIQLPGGRHKQVAAGKNSLQYLKEHTDANQVTHVRLQQYYFGFPVQQGYAIVHSKEEGGSPNLLQSPRVKMTGRLIYGLEEELGVIPEGFLSQAREVLDTFKKQYPSQNITESKVKPMIFVDDQHRAHWAYQVSLRIEDPSHIPTRPTEIVSARTGAVLMKWNDVQTLKETVNGTGYGGNEDFGQYQYGRDLPYLKISRDTETELCSMENEHSQVIDMGHEITGVFDTMAFPCQSSVTDPDSFWTGYLGDGYDSENGAYSPSNDALFAANLVHEMYHNWYDLEPLVHYDGSPMKLILRVHYGKHYENATWDGSQMTFGDGDQRLHPLVSIGVVAHELSHGFTSQNSGLIYAQESGGMNESFSDMAAQAAEHYFNNRSSWEIGGEVAKKSAITALRYMEKPSRDGKSIDRADQYVTGMNVHRSSGVYNRLFYLLAHKPGWDTRKAFAVMLKANMDYWTPNSTFSDGACGVLSATEDLGEALEPVKEALDEVAVSYKQCVDVSYR